MAVKLFSDTGEFVEGLGGIRPDKMTSQERMRNLMQGKPIDRVPFVPFIYGFTGINIGYSLAEFWSDGKKMFEAQIRTRQMYNYDGSPMFTYAEYGPWEFGGESRWPTEEYEQAPKVIRHPVETEEDAWNLQLPDVTKVPTLQVGIEFSKMQRKHGRTEEVYEECRRCIEKGKKAPRGFILMSGCEVPAMAPPYNVWMMRKAVSDFGWYD